VSSYRVAYVRVPSFYATVEQLDHPELRARPVVVGGSPGKRGKVQSASSDALAQGVVEGMAVEDVASVCPEAALLRTNMKRYREVASLLQISLREVSQGIEVDGLSGAYLELIGDAQGEEGQARALAQQLIDAVRDALGLPLQVGIAPVKFLAQLVAQEVDASGVHCISASEVDAFLAPLPLARLPGVGAKTRACLATMQIETIGEMLRLDARVVEAELGKHGRRILAYARGEDDSRVRTALHPKTLSHEFTFEEPVRERAHVESQLATLCQIAEGGLRKQRLCATKVAVKIRYAEGKTATRTRTLVRPVLSASEIHSAAIRLLDRTEVGVLPLALVGIALAGLGPEPEPDPQLDLFRS
jgi:DNA polymerase-4